MPHDMSADEVLGLAPDSLTRASAQVMADVSRWDVIGRDGNYLWGVYLRDTRPVYAAVDVMQRALHCSCPAKLRPCRHGLALYLVHVTMGEQIEPKPLNDEVVAALRLS